MCVRRLVVVIVEASLAYRQYLRMRRQSYQFVGGYVRLFSRIVRMRADGAVDGVELLCDRKDFRKTPDTRRDRHHAADPSRQGAGDDGRPLLCEIRKVEMAVTVDQHKMFASGCST